MQKQSGWTWHFGMEGENRSMNLPGYYSSGQFARMANVSIRTIRFYDKQNILRNQDFFCLAFSRIGEVFLRAQNQARV